jgi:hypothetical protein
VPLTVTCSWSVAHGHIGSNPCARSSGNAYKERRAQLQQLDVRSRRLGTGYPRERKPQQCLERTEEDEDDV